MGQQVAATAAELHDWHTLHPPIWLVVMILVDATAMWCCLPVSCLELALQDAKVLIALQRRVRLPVWVSLILGSVLTPAAHTEAWMLLQQQYPQIGGS